MSTELIPFLDARYVKALRPVLTPVSLTGTTTRTVVSTITVPKEYALPGRLVRVFVIVEANNSANDKIYAVQSNVEGGGLSGAGFVVNAALSGASRKLATQGNLILTETGQMGGIVNSYAGLGSSDSALSLYETSFDLEANDLDLMVAFELTNASDTLTLHSFSVEVI